MLPYLMIIAGQRAGSIESTWSGSAGSVHSEWSAQRAENLKCIVRKGPVQVEPAQQKPDHVYPAARPPWRSSDRPLAASWKLHPRWREQEVC